MDPNTPEIVVEPNFPKEITSVDLSNSIVKFRRRSAVDNAHIEKEELGEAATTFAKLVKTVQFIKHWTNRPEKIHPRDEFLGKFKYSVRNQTDQESRYALRVRLQRFWKNRSYLLNSTGIVFNWYISARDCSCIIS